MSDQQPPIARVPLQRYDHEYNSLHHMACLHEASRDRWTLTPLGVFPIPFTPQGFLATTSKFDHESRVPPT